MIGIPLAEFLRLAATLARIAGARCRSVAHSRAAWLAIAFVVAAVQAADARPVAWGTATTAAPVAGRVHAETGQVRQLAFQGPGSQVPDAAAETPSTSTPAGGPNAAGVEEGGAANESDNWPEGSTSILLGVALATLIVLLIVGRVLSRQSTVMIDPAIVRTFNRRVSAWVLICVALSLTLVLWPSVTVFFFFLVSFWALREFITMTPTRRADHRTLFWVFILFTPAQYVLVAIAGIDRTNSILGFEINADLAQALAKIIGYEIYTVVIPVYGSLFIAARIAFTGDRKRFLERIAKIQFGLLICVYALSHAPALLYLDLGKRIGNQLEDWDGSTKGLLFFFILLVQFSDLMHFICDKLVGRHVIAAQINASRTWEGLIWSACLTAGAGMLIQLFLDVTPFQVYGAGFMAMLISIMGSSGSMTMSAIKRDRGVDDYGTLIQGHAGVLDRIDSMCFAAPIFYHVTRFFLEMK